MYNLVPHDSYTIPSEAEGLASSDDDGQQVRRASVEHLKATDKPLKTEEPEATTSISTGATTRRHKHTPSTGSAVATIAESDEDDKEHHSPDKDVSLDVLSSPESTEQGVDDVVSGSRGVDVEDGKSTGNGNESDDASEAETVVQA